MKENDPHSYSKQAWQSLHLSPFWFNQKMSGVKADSAAQKFTRNNKTIHYTWFKILTLILHWDPTLISLFSLAIFRSTPESCTYMCISNAHGVWTCTGPQVFSHETFRNQCKTKPSMNQAFILWATKILEGLKALVLENIVFIWVRISVDWLHRMSPGYGCDYC